LYTRTLGAVLPEQGIDVTAYSLGCAVAFFLLLYYGVGFDKASSRAGYFFIMVFFTEVYSVTLGQAVAALSPSIIVAGESLLQARPSLKLTKQPCSTPSSSLCSLCVEFQHAWLLF
jgi:hypothetical protein